MLNEIPDQFVRVPNSNENRKHCIASPRPSGVYGLLLLELTLRMVKSKCCNVGGVQEHGGRGRV